MVPSQKKRDALVSLTLRSHEERERERERKEEEEREEEEEEVGCLLEFAWNDNDGLVFSRENKGKK